MIQLVFGQDALAASQTDVQLAVAVGESGQVVDGYPMAFRGEVVGVSWRTDTPVTAGQMTIGPTINGTEDEDGLITVTSGSSGSKKVKRGLIPFQAGDVVGAEITTNGGFLPITADLHVSVWVIVYLEGI